MQSTREERVERYWREHVKAGGSCRVLLDGGEVGVGRILEKHGKGCDVEFASGRKGFFLWKKIWAPDDYEPPRRAMARVGDLVKLPRRKTADESQLALPASPGAPAVPASAPRAPAPAEEPATPAVGDAKAKRRSPQIRAHNFSAIGNHFRAARGRLGWSQATAAKRLEIAPNRLSQIELGDVVPDDETLLRFASAFDCDLEQLEELRDGKRAAVDAAPVETTTSEASTISISPPPRVGFFGAPVRDAVGDLDVDDVIALVELVGRVREHMPIPSDTDRKRAWYASALQMYRSSKGGA